MSRDRTFQHLKPISEKRFEVCRLSKPSSLISMDQYTMRHSIDTYICTQHAISMQKEFGP